jgi:hypothetical protein
VISELAAWPISGWISVKWPSTLYPFRRRTSWTLPSVSSLPTLMSATSVGPAMCRSTNGRVGWLADVVGTHVLGDRLDRLGRSTEAAHGFASTAAISRR